MRAKYSITRHTPNWKTKVPRHDSKLEMKVRRILEKLNVSFRSQEYIRTKYREWPFLVDFIVEGNFIIEVQGGLHKHTWAGKPALMRMKKDEVKKNCLEAEGYKVLYVWDSELKDLAGVEEKIKTFLVER